MSAKTQTIDNWLRTHARHQPDSVALTFERRDWTYHQLETWVNNLARGLQHKHGLKRGDRLAYYGKNSDVQVAFLFACAQLGLVFVPLNWRLSASELNYIVKNCTAKMLFVTEDFQDQIEAVVDGTDTTPASSERARTLNAPPEVQRDAVLEDPYLIVYTSGTTGRPKGAVLTQEAVLWNAIISVHAHDFTPKDHTLNLLPLFHVGGINIQMMPTFFVGGQVTLHAAFDPETALNAMETDGITSTVCVPTVMKALLNHQRWEKSHFPTLRLINTGSTDVPVDILATVNTRNIPMVQVYGATETGPIATYQKALEARSTIGSIGRSGAHTEVRVFRDDGTECNTGEPGEIWVKGPNNFSYYWNDPEGTERALEDGWFKTGDIAYCDANGLFWFAGRSKHVIVSGGENIYPAELERILNKLDGIIEVAIVAQADAKWGEVPVVAAVIEPDGPDKFEILSAFDGQIARFKRPKDVVFLDQLPKNALGKVLIDDVKRLVVHAANGTIDV